MQISIKIMAHLLCVAFLSTSKMYGFESETPNLNTSPSLSKLSDDNIDSSTLASQPVVITMPIEDENDEAIQEKLQRIVEKKIREEVPSEMRSIYRHDIFGIISGTTTSFLTKVISGATLLYINSIQLKTESITQDKMSKIIFGNETVQDLIDRGLFINFVQLSIMDIANNSTIYATHPYSKTSVSSFNKTVNGLGIISGLYLIVSGFADLKMAGYSIYRGKKSDQDLNSIIMNAIEYRRKLGDNKKEITELNIVDFVDYAIGEYLDMYQKRGKFNSIRLLAQLKKW